MGTRIYYDLKLHHLTVQWRINQLGQFLIMWFWDAGFLAREIAVFGGDRLQKGIETENRECLSPWTKQNKTEQILHKYKPENV